MLSVFITPVYTKLLLNVYSLGPQSKETSHVTLDTSKNTFETPFKDLYNQGIKIQSRRHHLSYYKRRQALVALFDNLIHF